MSASGINSMLPGRLPQLATRMVGRAALAAVEGVADPHLLGGGQSAEAGIHVGEPAQPALEPRPRVRDHRGVDAESGHDEERVFTGCPLDVGDRGDAEVDRAGVATERDRARLLEARVGDADVACEEVAGAGGEEGEHGILVAEPLGHGADGAVTAGREDERRARVESLSRLALPFVFDAGLEPEQVDVAGASGRILHRRFDAVDVYLDRVVDHGDNGPGSALAIGHVITLLVPCG
jgi:hypothetical protein